MRKRGSIHISDNPSELLQCRSRRYQRISQRLQRSLKPFCRPKRQSNAFDIPLKVIGDESPFGMGLEGEKVCKTAEYRVQRGEWRGGVGF